MHRIMTRVRETGAIFVSPFVYPEKLAKERVRKFKRYDGLLRDPKRTICVTFPVACYPEQAVWQDKFAQEIDHRVQLAERAWDSLGECNSKEV